MAAPSRKEQCRQRKRTARRVRDWREWWTDPSGDADGSSRPRGLFMFNATVAALLGLFGIYRIRRRAPKSIKEQARYIVLPGAPFTSEELYTAVRDQMDKDSARMAGRF